MAYSTLLFERRRALHRLVAAAIEELYSDRLAEHHEAAHHYYEAKEWEKALDYLMKAAQKATDAYANQDALGYFDRALEAAHELGKVPLETFSDIYGGKAQICFATSEWDEAVANYSTLVGLAREAGNREIEGLALGGLGFALVLAHDFQSAEATADEALSIADELDDDAVRVGALMITTFLEALRGRVSSSIEYCERTAELAARTGQAFYESFCDELFILGYSWQSLYVLAHKNAEVGVARAKEYGFAEPLVFSMWAQGVALASNGRYSEAIAVLEDDIALCERIGDKAVRSRAWNTLGWVHGELCDFERAGVFNRKGLELAHEVGDPEITINAELNLVDCALATGDRKRAEHELEELYAALPAMHEWMKWRYSQHLMHSLGEAKLMEGEVDRALALADECLALAEPTESQKNVVKGRRLRGQALAAKGDLDAAAKELATALEVAQTAGNPPQLWKTWAAIGELRGLQGDEGGAQTAYTEAVGVIRKVARDVTDEQLRLAFLSSEHVRTIEAAAETGAAKARR